MSTNEERRANAKRKLDLQVAQRAQEARQRRYLMIAAALAAVVLAIGATTTVVLRSGHKSNGATDGTSSAADALNGPQSENGQLPKFVASPTLGANCQYPATAAPASKKVEPPRSGKVPTDPAEVSVSMLTDQGPIGLMLANGQSPCTVNSFVSLGNKDYFNNTFCHRLTTSPSLKVLQCGDPTGEGTGGPGYEFGNEYPTDQYPADSPKLFEPVIYPRGTVAMAHSRNRHDNGSQFFLVYADSQLPPDYTVFGRIQDDGLATLDKIAEAGVQGGESDGPPAVKVMIKSVLVD